MGIGGENNVVYLDVPDKSESDKKIYKIIQLSNGLKAVLVSDPTDVPHDGLTSSSESEKSRKCSCAKKKCNCETERSSSSSSEASTSSSPESSTTNSNDSEETDSSLEGDEKLAACGLMVDVGSFSEPKNCQGLAHFLEHMIFMGSEKYPEENAFDSHIKKCGGFDNANTECEETLYYFEVSEKHLDSSLDIFSNLFKTPLMKKDAMQRERGAVESEYQQTKLNDEVRRDQILAGLSTPGFPQETFAWGNLKSLKDDLESDDYLYQLVHEFRKRHYSAHRIYVAIQARLPIDELESLVVKHFADIPNNGLSGYDFSKYPYDKCFIPKFHEEVYFVKPIENITKLELSWVLPPMDKLYKYKPDEFLSYLFGYEGEGSLCAYLRKRLWALELLAGTEDSGFDSNSFYSLFTICIVLTEEGFEMMDEVLKATFAYIKLFNNSEYLKKNFGELQTIEKNSFRFQNQKAAYDNVQNLLNQLKHYPSKDMLTGPYLYYEYNQQELQDILKLLNKFNFNIMISSMQKYENIQYDKKEKWFGTEYTTIPMPQKWKDMWVNSEPIDELHLPLPNQFIASDFRIFWNEAGNPSIPAYPKKISNSKTSELWFKQDDTFGLPQAYLYFHLLSPLPRECVKNDVMCSLYTELVKYRMVEDLYPATVANLNYQFYSSEKGVVLKVNGYNEKLPELVKLITKIMISMKDFITEEQLHVFKVNLKKYYFNNMLKPKTLNKDIRLSIVESIHWPMIMKFKYIDKISLCDMKCFVKKFPKQLYVQALMQGNLTENNAQEILNTLVCSLNTKPIEEPEYIENRTVQLPQGSHFIRTKAINEKDANTVVCNFYQIGPCSVRNESILDLLMMFVEEPLFDQLRTKEQLGYYVGAQVRLNYGIIGYTIMVNSQETKFAADYVEERIEHFRSKMIKILKDIDDDEFEHVRESLIKLKLVVDMALLEEVQRNWNEVTNEEYFFDRRKKEVDILKVLTKQELIDFLIENERTNLRKLSVQVIGHKPAGGQNVALMEANDTSSDDGDDSKDDEEEDDELFEQLAAKLEIAFMERDGDATAITDIEDFKENLHVYPITKTVAVCIADKMEI